MLKENAEMPELNTVRDLLGGLLGRRVRSLLPVIIGVLVLLGFVWQGWWLWAGLIFIMGRRHAELLDEITPLDPGRRFLAIVTLFLFLIVIAPVPLRSF